MAIYRFEIPLRGSLGALYLGMFLFLLSAVGIGLMISSLAVTQQQGILGVFLEGDSYALLFNQYWPMAIIAVVTLTAAGWLFRHRMG